MKKIEKLKLKKSTIGELQNDQMKDLTGAGLYATEFYFDSSINTKFTQLMSCCEAGQDCMRPSCYNC